MYNQGIIDRLELVLLVKHILRKFQDLFDWFKQFVGFDDPATSESSHLKFEQIFKFF